MNYERVSVAKEFGLNYLAILLLRSSEAIEHSN